MAPLTYHKERTIFPLLPVSFRLPTPATMYDTEPFCLQWPLLLGPRVYHLFTCLVPKSRVIRDQKEAGKVAPPLF